MKKSNTKVMITIQAEFVRETNNSYLLDCEGDLEWFPKSEVKFSAEKQELNCPKWILQKKFPNEEY